MKDRITPLIAAAVLAVILVGTSAPAARAGGFSFTFEWGDIPLCTSGQPNIVANPRFTLRDVPPGTVVLSFTLRDLNVPGYDHGGGEVRYTGQTVIAPGAFRYRSPCPPNERHTYQWQATAIDAAGRAIATAAMERVYP